MDKVASLHINYSAEACHQDMQKHFSLAVARE